MMTYRLFRSRPGRALTALVLGLPALTGCYEYVPITGAPPSVGEMVSFEITDSGRVGLSDRFGAGLAAIEGRVQATQRDQFVIDVYRVSHLTGESALWTGETVRLQRAYVGMAKGREFSRTRTTMMAVGAAAAVGVLIASAKLAGAFNGSTDEPAPPKPISVRIPFRIPVGLRP
jgi:hypothetical protein